MHVIEYNYIYSDKNQITVRFDMCTVAAAAAAAATASHRGERKKLTKQEIQKKQCKQRYNDSTICTTNEPKVNAK